MEVETSVPPQDPTEKYSGMGGTTSYRTGRVRADEGFEGRRLRWVSYIMELSFEIQEMLDEWTHIVV